MTERGESMICGKKRTEEELSEGSTPYNPPTVPGMFMISHVLVHGDRRKYLTALITLDDVEIPPKRRGKTESPPEFHLRCWPARSSRPRPTEAP
jgi:hypothetical protein